MRLLDQLTRIPPVLDVAKVSGSFPSGDPTMYTNSTYMGLPLLSPKRTDIFRLAYRNDMPSERRESICVCKNTLAVPKFAIC